MFEKSNSDNTLLFTVVQAIFLLIDASLESGVPDHQFLWLVWRGGNGVGRINKVNAHNGKISDVIGDFCQPVFHHGIHPGPLSLAIPPWVGAMSTGKSNTD